MSRIVNIIEIDGKEVPIKSEEYSELIQDRVMIDTVGYKRRTA